MFSILCNKYLAMNTSFRISLLYLLLIIPQHGNSPLPVMESWLQKDQDDGFVQRDMTSSLTGGDESFGSAHQTYQNSLIRKKKADSEITPPATAHRKYSSKLGRSSRINQPFEGPYQSVDCNAPAAANERDETSLNEFERDSGIPRSKYRLPPSSIGNPNLRPRLTNRFNDDKYVDVIPSKNLMLYNNKMNHGRMESEQILNPLREESGKSAKWSMCKRLKTRYAPNPVPKSGGIREDVKYSQGMPIPNGYLNPEDDRRGREIDNREYKQSNSRPDKNPQILDSNADYYDLLGEDDSNAAEDYNDMPTNHELMHKREDMKQFQQQHPVTSKSMLADFPSKTLMDAFRSGAQPRSYNDDPAEDMKETKTRDVNRVGNDLIWQLNSDSQSQALNDVVKSSQRALQEVQAYQQKSMSFKSPEGTDIGFKRESRNQPMMQFNRKTVKFDDRRLKREDEDEQKNMKTGTDEGGGGEYEDEEGKGHKDEEEYYEDADLSNDESGNDRTTDDLNQRYVKREIPGDAPLKNTKDEPTDNNPQDYELNLENAPVENAGKSGKSSFHEGEKTKKNSARKGVKIWDQWGKWSPCSVTCGVGRSTRWRHCIGGGCAQGEKEAQIKRCTNPACRKK